MSTRLLIFQCFLAAVASFAAVSNVCAQQNVKLDEKILFFPTAAYLDRDEANWNVPIHGWIFEPAESIARRKTIEYALRSKYGLRTTAASKPLFDHRVRLLLADNERGKKIKIRIAGSEFQLPASAKNGHFRQVLRIPTAQIAKAAEAGRLTYEAVMRLDDPRRFVGTVFLVPPVGYSVISDIDDTIKVSDVLDRKSLLGNTFYEAFEAVEGMSEYYRTMASDKNAVFHFVSSSPWQLYEPLSVFMYEHKFPPAEFHLKDFRFKDRTLLNLFKEGIATKPPLIKNILARFPRRQFVLIGDSGEQDPEVYASIMNEFPEQIVRCLIRNVTEAKADDERFRRVFKDIPPEKWQLFSHVAELSE